ncbi:TetR family transcriptional regulator [Acuticoccus sp. I52.16.1]|uniref:TetR family transcriptional regulator n=1 Tax=Acuticoccus sp. I52.16.1 TaxID=2928472 RepID=UPI001FD06AB2|nr:TetR family transcriptional regulator [Acuticoccus sp. I52.16.1]UOM36572.1 TetR family transcriptional regulator [Acuticoccus sp. I52.16.1]
MEIIRRRQVIDAVVVILSAQGWRDLTIREISDVSGVSAGVITHYFGAKQSIIADTINDVNQKVIGYLSAIEETSAATARLEGFVDLCVNHQAYGLPPPRYWMAVYGRSPFDAGILSEMQRLHGAITGFVQRAIEAGVRGGGLRPVGPVEDVAFEASALIYGQLIGSVLAASEMPVERSREALTSALSGLVGATLEPRPVRVLGTDAL